MCPPPLPAAPAVATPVSWRHRPSSRVLTAANEEVVVVLMHPRSTENFSRSEGNCQVFKRDQGRRTTLSMRRSGINHRKPRRRQIAHPIRQMRTEYRRHTDRRNLAGDVAADRLASDTLPCVPHHNHPRLRDLPNSRSAELQNLPHIIVVTYRTGYPRPASVLYYGGSPPLSLPYLRDAAWIAGEGTRCRRVPHNPQGNQ